MASTNSATLRPCSTQIVTPNLETTSKIEEHVPIKEYFIKQYRQQTLHAISTDYPEPNTTTNASPTKILAWSYTTHGFAYAISQAYSLHQHLRLTPDDVWLTIAQGVSQHINNNAERFRNYFVKHQGQEMIIIFAGDILNMNANRLEGDWPETINRLTRETDKRVQKVDLRDTLESDFSTSTSASITASRVILLDAMKKYFQYRVLTECGIPKVTLEGTLQDWVHLQEKVHRLRELSLDMDFWLDRLEPVVWKLVATYRGEIDEDFWSKPLVMQGGGSGRPTYWTGWISAFFPYDKTGKKLTENSIEVRSVPGGRVNVPFTTDVTKGLEFSAGFLGARQYSMDQSDELVISPIIGWLVVDAESNQDSAK